MDADLPVSMELLYHCGQEGTAPRGGQLLLVHNAQGEPDAKW